MNTGFARGRLRLAFCLLPVAAVSLEASPQRRNLNVAVQVRAEEAGHTLAVLPRVVRVSLPGTGLELVLDTDHNRAGETDPAERGRYFTAVRAPGELTEAAFDALVAAGKARVRVQIEHFFTTAAFARQAVRLDETREVALTTAAGPHPTVELTRSR